MKRIIKIVAIVIAWMSLALAIAALIGAIVILKPSMYRIQTGSMTPTFPVNTIVVDTPTGGYKVGDAITFVANGEVVTHVFRGYNPDGSLITRGIANPSNDNNVDHPVMPSAVRGRVMFQVPVFAGAFWTSLDGYTTIGAILMVIAAIILFPPSRKKAGAVKEASSTRRKSRGRHVAA